MKTTNYNFRKTIFVFGIIFFTTLTIISCKKTTADDTSITDDEVAEMTTEAVSPATGGLTLQSENTIELAAKNNLTCGMSKDTTIVKTNTNGAYSYSHTLQANKSMVCTNNVPSKITFTFAGTSAYTAPKMTSDDKSTGSFAISGLPSTSTYYEINGTYVRTGTQQSTVHLKRSISSVITITVVNVKVSKATKKIISGTATADIQATTSGGKSISTTAAVAFLGNNAATLTLKSGAVINFNWLF